MNKIKNKLIEILNLVKDKLSNLNFKNIKVNKNLITNKKNIGILFVGIILLFIGIISLFNNDSKNYILKDKQSISSQKDIDKSKLNQIELNNKNVSNKQDNNTVKNKDLKSNEQSKEIEVTNIITNEINEKQNKQMKDSSDTLPEIKPLKELKEFSLKKNIVDSPYANMESLFNTKEFNTALINEVMQSRLYEMVALREQQKMNSLINQLKTSLYTSLLDVIANDENIRKAFVLGFAEKELGIKLNDLNKIMDVQGIVAGKTSEEKEKENQLNIDKLKKDILGAIKSTNVNQRTDVASQALEQLELGSAISTEYIKKMNETVIDYLIKNVKLEGFFSKDNKHYAFIRIGKDYIEASNNTVLPKVFPDVNWYIQNINTNFVRFAYSIYDGSLWKNFTYDLPVSFAYSPEYANNVPNFYTSHERKETSREEDSSIKEPSFEEIERALREKFLSDRKLGISVRNQSNSGVSTSDKSPVSNKIISNPGGQQVKPKLSGASENTQGNFLGKPVPKIFRGSGSMSNYFENKE